MADADTDDALDLVLLALALFPLRLFEDCTDCGTGDLVFRGDDGLLLKLRFLVDFGIDMDVDDVDIFNFVVDVGTDDDRDDDDTDADAGACACAACGSGTGDRAFTLIFGFAR